MQNTTVLTTFEIRLSDVLKKLRKLNGNTQKQIDAILDKRSMYCFDVERYKIRIKVEDLYKLAKHYDINVDDILSEANKSGQITFNECDSKKIVENRKNLKKDVDKFISKLTKMRDGLDKILK